MTPAKAAQTCLKERWELIARAGSINEMKEIGDTHCLCPFRKPERYLSCSDCIIVDVCDNTYPKWVSACYYNNDLPAALTAAETVCERLRGIEKGE